MAKLKNFLNKTDVIEFCSRERMNTKWRFYKLTNLTIFADLLRDVTLGCRDAVSTKHLPKNHTINSITHEEKNRQPDDDNLCHFRALALHLHGYQRLEEETPTDFKVFLSGIDRLSLSQFQEVDMEDIPNFEELLLCNILLYDIDIVEENFIGEIARRSMQKEENTVRLLRYNIHLCYVSNVSAVFHYFSSPNCDIFFQQNIQFGGKFHYMQ